MKRLSWTPFFDIGMEHDVIFSPLFASSEEWENGLFKSFPIYDEITRELGRWFQNDLRISDTKPDQLFVNREDAPMSTCDTAGRSQCLSNLG